MNIKAIADQTLKRIRSATSCATYLHKDCCKDVARSNENAAHATHVANNKKLLWRENEKELIDWFRETNHLPEEPFQLKSAVKVVDVNKFYEGLRLDIECGPRKERSMFGALQEDLICLKNLIKHTRTYK